MAPEWFGTGVTHMLGQNLEVAGNSIGALSEPQPTEPSPSEPICQPWNKA